MTSYPDDADGAALERIASDGVDMKVPRQIDFAVAAPSDEVAQRIAQGVQAAGYPASVHHDEGEPDEDGVIDPDDPEHADGWGCWGA